MHGARNTSATSLGLGREEKIITAPLFSPLLAMRVSERGASNMCLPSQGRLKCQSV
jgi:hypothetical protein